MAAEKSEFGVCGVVGGKMVIELLADTMRRRKGLTLLSFVSRHCGNLLR